MNQSQDSFSTPPATVNGRQPLIKRLPVLLIGAAVCGLLIGGTIIFIMIQLNANRLPGSVVRQVRGFAVYFPGSGLSTDFKLVQKSISYSNHVLVFSLRNPVGENLTFTEEATSSQFGPSSLPGLTEFNTEYGQGFVSDSSSSTVGTLFASNGSWVVINAPTPIGATLMQQFIQSLAPVTD